MSYRKLRKQTSNLIQKLEQINYDAQNMNITNSDLLKRLRISINSMERVLKEIESTIKEGAE